jgi:hypothetical protein
VQIELHVSWGQNLQERLVRDPELISKITTAFGYNPKNKQQSSKCKSPTSPCPKTVRQDSLNVAIMPTVVQTLKELFINP